MSTDAKHISSMLSYCNTIDEITNKYDGDKEEFFKRPSFRFSCSFCVEQIGYSAEQLDLKIREKHPEADWSRMIKLGINITESYDMQDLNVIWDFITNEVEKLRKICERILYEMTKR